MIKITKKQLTQIQNYSSELITNYPRIFSISEEGNLQILVTSLTHPPRRRQLFKYNAQLNGIESNLTLVDYMCIKFNMRIGIHSSMSTPYKRYGSLEKLPGKFMADHITFTPKRPAKDDLERIALDLFLAASEHILQNTSTRKK